MNSSIYDDSSDIYVCITHRQAIPCEDGEYHLVSNWPSDIDKILKED